MGILHSAEAVLRLFKDGHSEIGVATLVRELRWPKSTSSRILSQMAAAGFLERDLLTRQYHLGSLFEQLTDGQACPRSPIQAPALALLRKLCDRIGYMAHLSVLNGAHTVLVGHVAGWENVGTMSPVGSRLPASVTAIGRALLARLDDEEFKTLYGQPADKLVSWRPRCPQTVAALKQKVQDAKNNGFAIAIDEGLPGIGAIATSLCDLASGSTLGLAISFPAEDMRQSEIKDLQVALLSAVGSLGKRLNDPLWMRC